VGVLSWARHRPAPASRFELVDRTSTPGPGAGAEADAVEAVFAIVVEAVVLQDAAEAVLAAVGRGEHLGLVAPRGGPLVRRFFALRDALPQSGGPWLQAQVRMLDTILLHHAMQVSTSMEFLATAGRSDQLARITGSYGSLGRPAELLEQVYAELRARRGTAEHVSDVSPRPRRELPGAS
jgi:hypothetical protein